jgi:hypothetical protein
MELKMASVNMDNLNTFFYWIKERILIHDRKENVDKWPWTTDPILQMFRFCNVFREWDTVTIQFRKLFEDYRNHPNLWFAYCLARQINMPETVQYIMNLTPFPDEWRPDKVQLAMESLSLSQKIYTSAYMLCGVGATGMSKPAYTVNVVLQPVWDAYARALPECFTTSLEIATRFLQQFPGWGGGFLAYEVVTDLRHTRYLQNAPDIMTWANPGPGAKRGLNRIFGRPLESAIKIDQANLEMRWLLEELRGQNIAHVNEPYEFEMRDIEHSLCEVDKYLRVKNGEGKPRQRYHRSV